MHFFPLVYFSGLTYFLWSRHHTINIAVYMSVLFAVTSLCAAIMVEVGVMQGSGILFDGWAPQFGVMPTLLYCILTTITILPFSFVRPDLIENITNNHKLLILGLSVVIVLQGLQMFYLVGSSISEVLNGDFKDLKNAGYDGDVTPADIKMLAMPFPLRLLFYFSFLTTFGLPLFFYYSCIEKRPLWLTLPLLASSVSPILRGIMSADRTEIIYYGLMFLYCLVFFWRKLTRKLKWALLIITLPVASIGLAYVVAVSESRFEDNSEGAGGSMLAYAGQSYANFCYFYEHHNNDLYYFERELPITSLLLTNSQYTEVKGERSAKEGFFVGVFASHTGAWLLDVGVAGAVILSLLFALLCILVIKYHKRRVFDISEVLLLFILASVPIFGIFYYRFYNANIAIQYLVALFLYMFSKIKIVWFKEK